MSLSRKLQQRKAAVLSDSLEKLHVLLTAKIPWVARAVFQILATDRATGGTESPVDFPTSRNRGWWSDRSSWANRRQPFPYRITEGLSVTRNRLEAAWEQLARWWDDEDLRQKVKGEETKLRPLFADVVASVEDEIYRHDFPCHIKGACTGDSVVYSAGFRSPASVITKAASPTRNGGEIV